MLLAHTLPVGHGKESRDPNSFTESWPATRPPSPRAVDQWHMMPNAFFSDPTNPSHELQIPSGPWLNKWAPIEAGGMATSRTECWNTHWPTDFPRIGTNDGPQPARCHPQHYRHIGIELTFPCVWINSLVQLCCSAVHINPSKCSSRQHGATELTVGEHGHLYKQVCT